MAKTWKQPRCSSVGECIDKLYYTQTREYYWAPEKKKKKKWAIKPWKNLTCILLSERNQAEEGTYCTIPAPWHLWKSQHFQHLVESWSLWSHWFFSWGCKCVLVVYFWDRMKISGCQGLAGEGWGMNWWSTEEFLGQWQHSVWCYTNGYVIYHLTFVLTHRMYNSRSEP